VSEEQSAATEQVSASTEEMSAQVQEMIAQAQELAKTAEQLNQLVARFSLDNSRQVPTAPPVLKPGPKEIIPLRRAA